MPAWLRGTLLALAALAGAAWLATHRLDLSHPGELARARLAEIPDLSLNYGRARLSLWHGAGIELEHASLDFFGWHLEAPRLIVEVRLLPFLLGKLEPEAIRLVKPRILPGRSPAGPESFRLPRLPFERLHLDRAALMNPSGTHAILEDFDLELRRLGPNRDMGWELRASRGRASIHGHGRVQFRRGRIAHAFGKLRLRDWQADAWIAALPESIRPLLAGHSATGAWTMRYAQDRTWSLFGELGFEDSSGLAPVRVRGKLSRAPDAGIRLRDTFIHLGEGVVALSGVCREQCRAEIHLTRVPALWLAELLPAHPGLSGELNGALNVRGSRKRWQAAGELNLRGLERGGTRAPDLRLTGLKLERSGPGVHAHASLRAGSNAQALRTDFEAAAPAWRLTLTPESFWPDAWPALGSLLTALAPAPAASFSGRGPLALAKLVMKGGESSVTLELEGLKLGEDAELAFGSFVKPARIELSCESLTLVRAPTASSLSGERCVLGSSHAGHLSLAQHRGIELQLADAELDLDEWSKAGVSLPAPFSRLHGRIRGGLDLSWPEGRPLPNVAEGALEAQGFGPAGGGFNGSVAAHAGSIELEGQWSGAGMRANLRGRLELASGKGMLDLNSGRVELGPGQWPVQLAGLSLSGTLHDIEARLQGQAVEIRSGRFRLEEARLSLERLRGTLAHGALMIPEATLAQDHDGLFVGARLRLQRAQAQALPWLSSLAGGALRGRLFVNARIRGRLPPGSLDDWEGDGDLALFSGAWQPGDPELAGHRFLFRKLELRLRARRGRIEARRIRLLSHGRRYAGSARLVDGRITGELVSHDGVHLALAGTWPQIRWHLKNGSGTR